MASHTVVRLLPTAVAMSRIDRPSFESRTAFATQSAFEMRGRLWGPLTGMMRDALSGAYAVPAQCIKRA